MDTSPVVLITGASRGIGAATARLAAQRGYAVVVNYRQRADAAAELVSELRASGARAMAIAADVSDEAAVTAMFDQAEQTLGPISALVNNAGVLAPQMAFVDTGAARWQQIFACNVFGTLLCSRAALQRMLPRRQGCIVNVSSLAARSGSPHEYVDYAASKGAIDSFTVGLAREVAGQGVRVNAVRPGLIATDIHASGGEPDRLARWQSRIPLGRGGQAAEVAAAILWLLSDEASFTTGALLDVAGGI